MNRPPVGPRNGITSKGGVPITGSRTAMRPRSSILANQSETSKDLEARLSGDVATQPFTYEGGAATLPTDTHDGSTEGEPYIVASPVDARTRSMGRNIGLDKTDEINMGAVGYESGATKAKSGNPIISGFPTARRRSNSSANPIPGKRSR